MRKSKFNETQIVAMLKDAESGVPVADHKRVHRVYCALRLNLPRRTTRRVPRSIPSCLRRHRLAKGFSRKCVADHRCRPRAPKELARILHGIDVERFCAVSRARWVRLLSRLTTVHRRGRLAPAAQDSR
jgi:hypothetical protein